MATDFQTELKERLSARGLSLREFARLLGRPNGFGFVARVASGRRTPPLDEAGAWADALGIEDPSERDRFVELAHLAHCPPLVRERFEAMRDQIRRKGRGRRP